MSKLTWFIIDGSATNNPNPKEVVLSTLVSSLSFEPGNDEITWVASGIAKPFVKGKNAAIDISRGPAMPMRVTVLE
jgi:hypothetical protein